MALGSPAQAAAALSAAHCDLVLGPGGLPILLLRGAALAFPAHLPCASPAGLAWEFAVHSILSSLAPASPSTVWLTRRFDEDLDDSPPAVLPPGAAPGAPPTVPRTFGCPQPTGAGIAALNAAEPSAGPMATLVRLIDDDELSVTAKLALVRLTRATPALVALAFSGHQLSLKVLGGEPSLFCLRTGTCVASIPALLGHELNFATAVASEEPNDC